MVAGADHSNQPLFSEYISPTDWPWTITILVSEARRIISYFEIPEDKRPPKSLWHSPTKCNDWIKKAFDVKDKGGQGIMSFDDAERE